MGIRCSRRCQEICLEMIRSRNFAIIVAAYAAIACAPYSSAADLAFQRITLVEYEDGSPNVPGYEYQPGESVWLSVRIAGFQRATVDAQAQTSRVQLSWQARAQDPSGTLVAPPMRGIIDETLRLEDKDWIPKFLLHFNIPQYAPRGTYKIPVTIRDDIAKKDLNGQVEFRVRGSEPPPSDAPLGVRNFQFLAKPDDRFELRPAVYQPGSALIVRFDIIGYKFDGNNHFSVDYGISISAPSNAEGVAKTLFTQDVAASQTSESFYGQRWVPGGFGINLDPNVPLGEHTLVLTLRDKVGGVTQEIRQTFEVKR
jgi:hypothetical protein